MGSVYKFYNQVEASKLKDILESSNIPTEIHSFENCGLDGVLRPAIGMGEIIVPDVLEEEAKKIIDNFVKKSEKLHYERIEIPQEIKKKRSLKWIFILAYILPLFGTGIGIIVNSFGDFIAILIGWSFILVGFALLFLVLRKR